MGQAYHPGSGDDDLLTEAERAFDLSARRQSSIWAGPIVKSEPMSQPVRAGLLARMFGRDGSNAQT